MKSIISIAFSIALLLSNTLLFAQYANLEFVENKGQWDSNVKFKGEMTNGAFFLQGKGFRVLQHNSEDLEKVAAYFHAPHSTGKVADHTKSASLPPSEKLVVRSHAYDVEFVNASTATILPDKIIQTYNNYIIGNDPAKWAGNCRIFQAITYQNLYPGVDVRYYTNEGRLKYDIIVKPGADISKIMMKYEGAEGLTVKNEQLVVKTSIGENREMKPYSYQVVYGVKKEVATRFKVSGKIVQFDIPSYAKNATLVIDPTIIFSTYTGSTSDNWGYSATYGPDGSFYSGGTVRGASYPISPGAFQTTWGGGSAEAEGPNGWDIGIMKFSPNGNNRVYATFLGGTGNEHPHSLVVDGQGNLVIGGRTSSGNTYPTTAATLGQGGDYDIILTKLNATGTGLIGSRRIGGTGPDGINIRGKYEGAKGAEKIRRNYGDDSRSEVILDGQGNILLASCTQSVGPASSGGFPTSAGAFQTTPGGAQDGVLIKASPDLSSILFSSLIGGSAEDAAFVLAIHPSNGNIYIGGNTVSTNLPGDKSGVLYPGFMGGETDGFVSIISPNGSTLIKTSYMGTDGADMLYGIQFDKFSFPYIMGTTHRSTWPVVNAPFSQTDGKQFISKLKADLSGFVYSTVFGSNIIDPQVPNLSPVAFLVDRCENVYVSGWGGDINRTDKYPNSGTQGLTVTPDALQTKTDGSDFYFFVLERDATRQLYGSFFGQFSTAAGGEHVDGGTSRFDSKGDIYQAICGCEGNGGGIQTTPGVWSPTSGAYCNLAAIKIAFNLSGIVSSVRSSINGVIQDTSGCVPLTVEFTDTIALGKTYTWNFGDGTPNVKTTTPNIQHTFTQVGTYQVMLISIDSSKCNVADTAYTHIRVRDDAARVDFVPTKLPPCESTAYTFTNTSTPATGKPFKANSFVWNFGDNTPPVTTGSQLVTHTFPGFGTYRVRLLLIDTNYCNAPDSMVKDIRISPNVDAEFVTPRTGCAPYNAVFNNTSAGGQQFFWNFGDGATSTSSSPTHLYPSPGTYTVRLTAIDSATCNIIDSTSFTITVSGIPVASFNYLPNPPQENTPVEFFNSSIGASRYTWRFGDGDTLNTTSTEPVKHTFNETRLYNTCLVATNIAGCADTTCLDVQARIIPLLDVPNAFTPNGDGINDKVFVRGFGITKMNWMIFNRWGAMVFQTADRTQGWDGMYKGALQPKEVYHYVLDVEFGDGTKYQKKGDITLL
ncbi:MAG: hypothetical protein JWQ96_1979 [Segetibacter sp.]|nr:hypothetical protein [Segetibacter sp.]